MSPIPWPFIGRRPAPTPPAQTPAEPAVRVVTTLPPRPATTAWESTRHLWEAAETAVLDDLTTLTARHGPWTAAVLLFTEEEGRRG